MRRWSRALPIMILLCALSGVAIKMGLPQGTLGLYQLRYFTTLSNLLAAGCALWTLARGRRGYLNVKGLALLCILVTAIVYHALLVRTFGGFALFSLGWWGNQLVHTVVPALTILDYLLFDPKGKLSRRCPLIWMAAPCGYFGFVLAMAHLGVLFPNSSTAYPYPFLDVWRLGWGPVVRNVLLLAAGFFLLGCALTALDRRLIQGKAPGVQAGG